MCTRYISPEDREIEAAWYIGARNADRWMRSTRPLYMGPFMRRARDVTEYERELVVGQWGLIPAASPSHIPQTGPRKGQTNGRTLDLQRSLLGHRKEVVVQGCMGARETLHHPCAEL